MNSKSLPIEQLQNIEPTIANRLREIGIRTRGDLQAVGPASAYRRICAKYPRKTIPVCYYVYSLEGALRDRRWDAIGVDAKRSLLNQVSANNRLQRMARSQRR